MISVDPKLLGEFLQMRGEGFAGGGVDKKIVDEMLDSSKGLDVKNIFTPEERNMLVLLALLEQRIPGYKNKSAREAFMAHQLSLAGFNRLSLERMANPIAPSPAAPTPQPSTSS